MSKADELKLNARELQLKMLFDEQEKRIADLEKKVNENDICIEDLELSNIDLQKQLEQAKELIKQLMYASRDCIAWYCLCDKAKQFLKEIEK